MNKTKIQSEHYRAAGVDIDAGEALVKKIAPFAAATKIPGANAGIGGFGGIFDLAKAGFPNGPKLVSGTDGVGSKLKLALLSNIHHTIGIDAVAMCVNDIITLGARPLFFLDYLATGKLDIKVASEVIKGVAKGCEIANCWLMGGETAEMPGFYQNGEYDVAGFVVGAIDEGNEIDPKQAAKNDVVIGVASSGIHSNGFSLVRKVLLQDHALSLDDCLSNDPLPLIERLLVPTRIYVDAMIALRKANISLKAVSHITGGGLWENPQRGIKKDLAISFNYEALKTFVQPIFRTIQSLGCIPETEMYRVFNMGIGLTIIVPKEIAEKTITTLENVGEKAAIIGKVISRTENAIIIDGINK